MFKGWEWRGQVSQSWELQIEAGEWAWTVWRLAALFRACQVVPEEETDTVVEGGRGWVWGLFFSWFYWSYYMWRWESGLLSTPITKAVLSCSNEWEGARGRARGSFRELGHRAASVEWQYFSRGVQACWKANPGLIDSSFNCDCHWGVWPVPPSFLHSWARVWTEQHCEWDLCGYPWPSSHKRRVGCFAARSVDYQWMILECVSSSVTGPASFQRVVCQLHPKAKCLGQIPTDSWLTWNMAEKWLLVVLS